MSSEMRSAPQRGHEDSFAHSNAMSAGHSSSHLHGRSPSAHLTVRQHSYGTTQPTSAEHMHSAGCDQAGSQEPDGLARAVSKGSQSHRLAVFSATSSFRAASGPKLSDRTSPWGSSRHLPSDSKAVQPRPEQFNAAYAVLPMTQTTQPCQKVGPGNVTPREVAVMAVRLSADDVCAICGGIEPCLTLQPATGADAVVRLSVAPPLRAAAQPGGATTRPATPRAAASEARHAGNQSAHIGAGATPGMLHRLMGLVPGRRAVPQAAVGGPQAATVESQIGDETCDLAARTYEGPTGRPSMLNHIYSASPEQAKSGRQRGSSTIEIEQTSEMSLSNSCALRGHAASAAISQGAHARPAAEHAPGIPESPTTDTVSTLSHTVKPVDSIRWARPAVLPRWASADSSWLHMPSGRRVASAHSGGSSGLLYAESGAAWMPQGRRRVGGGNDGSMQEDSHSVQMVVSGALTDGSRQSMGAPTRSYLEEDPRHMFSGAHQIQRDEAEPVRPMFVPLGGQVAGEGQGSAGGSAEADFTEQQLAENAGSMMLPMPPSMDMLF